MVKINITRTTPQVTRVSSSTVKRTVKVFDSYNPRKVTQVSTDFTSVNVNQAVDLTTYNKGYAFAGTSDGAPVSTVADLGSGLSFILAQGVYQQSSYGSANQGPRSIRFMCNGDKVAFYITAVTNAGGVMVYIDGYPTSLTPYSVTTGSATFNTIIFPSAKARLIEIRAHAALAGLYCQKPYELWKPEPRVSPRVLIMGDSYTSNANVTNVMNAYAWNIGPYIGSEDVWLDYVGGTGYGVTSATNGTDAPLNRYIDRINGVTLAGQTWDIATIQPDMIVISGGGENDIYKGRTNAQVIADATTVFTTARTKCPNAKLVFIEGFSPPGFTPSTCNPKYIAIRQALQTALVNIGVYYVDVATTNPWINGTGYVGATNASGNSDIYISSDTLHPNDVGHLYIRGRLAPKLRRILADDGTLVNKLI